MKFSIRDLMWLTVVVALTVGWWVDHRWIVALERERDEAMDDAHWLSGQWRDQFIKEETLDQILAYLQNNKN